MGIINTQKIINGKKQCSQCGKWFLVNNFSRDKGASTGRHSYCKNCQAIIMALYREKNRDLLRSKAIEYKKQYRHKYPLIYKRWREKYRKKKMRIPKYRISHRVSNEIRATLKGEKRYRHWEELVGYTLQDLMKHIESQFDNKMSWNNYGSYWHIDHIKPQSLFEFDKPEDKEFKECWGLVNLQPLEKIANIKKGNKY